MSPSVAARTLLLAALAATPPAAAQAQPSQPAAARAAAQAAPRDSSRLLRGARSRQAAFERVRFNHLPWVPHYGASECEERIGRFCMSMERDTWRPVPEAARVTAERDALLARLDSAAAELPGDEWIAGQRVRYLVEAGRPAEALAAARECRAGGGWCAALEGLAHHAGGGYAAADEAFARALAAMPERERREWTSLEDVLSAGDWRAFGRAPAARRDSLAARLWWLADPLWSTPGNERRTEHYARWVMDGLQERARTTEGWSWGSDLREILIRYGWAVGWERIRMRPGMGGLPPIVSHHPPDAWNFVPPLRAARDPLALTQEDWALDDPRAHSVYGPSYARGFHPLPHQVAVFRRAGRAVVVAAWEMDSVRDGVPTAGALALARSPDEAPAVAHAVVDGRRGVARLETEPTPVVVSLEARSDSVRRVQRARYALQLAPPRGEVQVSDILLLSAAAGLPETLDEAVPMARGSDVVRPGDRVGLFWEVYGVPKSVDTLQVAVSVTRTSGVGVLRGAAQRVGLASVLSPVRVQWREAADAKEVLARALTVSLPDLRPGDYVVRVTVRPRGGGEATAERRLRVVRARPGTRPLADEPADATDDAGAEEPTEAPPASPPPDAAPRPRADGEEEG